MRPESSCMCQYTEPVHTKTRFVILVHPHEYRKIKNGTGILTHLQLSNSEIIVDLDFTRNKRVNELIRGNECYILYPGENAINVSSPASKDVFKAAADRVVFILDATWPCAKKMMKLSRNLHHLPLISFENDEKSQFKIKQQPHALCLSTIESVKKLIDDFRELGIEDTETSTFLRPFEKMVEYQIECVLNPSNNHHSGKKSKGLREREFYKKETHRSLFFDQKNYLKN